MSIDTLRADHVGAYGGKGAETPILDGLAAAGVRFELAISPAPLTLVSHVTLLTGLDPPEHGVRHNGHYRLEAGVPTLAERFREAGFATSAFVSAYVLDRQFGANRGFDVYDDEIGLRAAGPSMPTRPANETIDRVLSWLDTAPDRFFLWVHLYDPHADYTPPEPYLSRFGESRRYDGEIAFADAEVGRLLRAINERFGGGTLTIVTADHGEGLGEHQERTHSLTLYDSTQHIPLILAGPRIPAGKVVPELVRLADVAPTVVDWFGLPELANGAGRSLRPLIEGTPDPPRVAWVETLATQIDFGWSPLLGVRTQTHKYIRAPRPELYAVLDDPGELHDLASQEPDRVRDLDRIVEERSGGPAQRPNAGELGPAARAQLEALGYVIEGLGAGTSAIGVVGGTDPKDQMDLIASLHEAASLMARQQFRAALERFDKLSDRGYEVAILHGMAALGAGELEIATRAARRAAELAPDRAAPHVLLGNVAHRRGRFEEARESFERARTLDPDEPGAWIGLGRLAEASGDRDGARKFYEHAMNLRTSDPESVWRLAAFEIEDGNADAARKLLAKLPPAEVRQPLAALRLAWAERAAGRGELARIRVNGALRAFPDSVDLLLLQAELATQADDQQVARRALLQAERVDPDSLRVRDARARQLAEQGVQLDRALEIARDVAEQDGRGVRALDTLARVRIARHEFEIAVQLANEGLSQPAADDQGMAARVSLMLVRAEALAGLGRVEAARASLDEARRAAADSPALVDQVKRAESALQSWSEPEAEPKRASSGS